MAQTTRRQLLAATTLFALGGSDAYGRTVEGPMPWVANEAYPPRPTGDGPMRFFTPEEAAAVDAMLSRLIPADELGPGAKETGGTLFIDRQLVGPFGGHDWLYMQGPFPEKPLASQGLQSPLVPREQYRRGLAALATYCRGAFGGRSFQQLEIEEQDRVLAGLEKGETKLPGFDGRMLFLTVQANAIEGFFADPVYGGNQGMAGWRLVGFPGTRYDYRDVMARPNEAYTMPPVSIRGRPEWGKRT